MFEKHCTMCGIAVKKDTAIKRFGKYLCSEQHAEEFVIREQQRQNEESRRDRRGGCC
ncbi:MAG: hypothetical protein KGZ37_05780 [Nitrosarchaeum sp.]|nr:hypothetical protein [Nitrosarchaeum sp.]